LNQERQEAFLKEERLTGRRHSELIYGQEYARRFAATILPLEDSRSYAKGELQPRTTVYVQEKVSSDIHWRLTMTIDRKTCRPVVKIKDVNKDDPPTGDSKEFQKDYLFNFSDEKENILDMAREMKRDLRLGKASKQSFQKAILELHKLFTEAQAISLEVDVLRRRDGKILCANSRFLFDDDAPNRATKIYMKLREPVLEDKSELYAEAFGLVYVKMRGNIGTVVNGAGLAMATNDAIHLYGGSSANFLDAGGQATKETMLEAFKIVMDDERVRTIFVNIYGGKWEM
jgi:succinyl-CoA synthetase beta subunit